MSPADVRLSKFLSLILRHRPEAAGIALDREGWAPFDLVVAASVQRRLARSEADLHRVIATNDKKRFALSPDGALIRAVQGHSNPHVRIAYEPQEPPPRLFHGTADRNLPAILAEGLKPGRRQFVHLSPDEETALTVGRRHGRPVILAVDSAGLHRDGHELYRAENGVWLIAHVPPAYIQTLGGK